MPLDVWMLMRMAERLYYRVVTSASPEAWENYETSLPLTQIGSAPYIELKGRFESLVASPHRPEENLWRRPPGN